LLGVQEAVGSNPAVPTFRFNHLEGAAWLLFPFGDAFGDALDFENRRDMRCTLICSFLTFNNYSY
jgi:hypothetical protein